MRASNKIVLASNNLHKFLEFKALLAEYPEIQLVPANELLRNADKIGRTETGDTYEQNSAAKARLTNLGTHYPALADDSGLEVAALNGAPGIKTARYAISRAGETQDQANIQKLLKDLQGQTGSSRAAKFVCVLSLVMEGVIIQGRGELNGTLSESPRGKNGFGYDPIFFPEGEKRTLAEMSDDEKNRISHRFRALQDLFQQLRKRGVVLAKP